MFFFVYRLHQIIAHKEMVFETLVTPERLHAATTELTVTLQENKRISSAHRHLLIRYAALKFMIDEAFRKLDDARRHVGKFFSVLVQCLYVCCGADLCVCAMDQENFTEPYF